MIRILIVSLCILVVAGQSTPQQTVKTIHVFVALCDNENQGIVPVPEKLGNGDDPQNNLYWGAPFGVKTFFGKATDWTFMSSEKDPAEGVLERCVFEHKTETVFLVADAYQGAGIEKTVENFLGALAGNDPEMLRTKEYDLGINGGADLLAYVGHNGLMDFELKTTEPDEGSVPRDAIVLACESKSYFQERLSKLGCRSVLLTTGFMGPEAYTLEAVIEGWIAGESGEEIVSRAARAYHKYQKCGIRAATKLFYSEAEKKNVSDR